MPNKLSRRNWLRQQSMAALAFTLPLKSFCNEEGITRQFGIENKLINLGSNENPYGISPLAKQAMLNIMGESHRYQFNIPDLQGFAKKIADYHHLTADHVLVTAGSTEALKLIPRHVGRGTLVTGNPTFPTLPNTAKRMGMPVKEIPLTPGKAHDLQAMLQAIDNDTSLVYICNPANPTSTIVSTEALSAFCREASKKAMVVIDEAYIDFLDNPETASMIGLLEACPNLVILRTFSKIHAMAGLRVGYALGNPALLDAMDKNYFNYSQLSVSNLSLAAAMASLGDAAHRQTCKQKNAEARNYMIHALSDMHIQAIPSHTNFIFFPLDSYPGDFAKDMLDRQVILRSGNYADGKWARVSVGTLDEMKACARIMQSIWKA